jgi:glutathione S-transferase
MASDKSSLTPASRTLWGVGTSRTIRPHWAMAELGLDYDVRPILPRTGETQTPEYTRLNARQKVPLLQDGDLTLTESAAIIAYLSDTYGTAENRLVPTDPRGRATCLEWSFFIISELDATSLYVMRRHRDLAHIYGEAPVANDAASTYFGRQMRSVERALSDGRPYLMGDRFGAADILLSTCVSWAVNYKVPVAGSALAFNARATARPAFKTATERNKPPVGVVKI